MARIVGIDLGTTNSLVAYMADGRPRVIPDRHDRTMVPSVVAMTDNGLIVGDPAKEHLTRNPERTVYSVKVTRYIEPIVEKGVGIQGEPLPHLYFHRPISLLLEPCFRAGFVLASPT